MSTDIIFIDKIWKTELLVMNRHIDIFESYLSRSESLKINVPSYLWRCLLVYQPPTAMLIQFPRMFRFCISWPLNNVAPWAPVSSWYLRIIFHIAFRIWTKVYPLFVECSICWVWKALRFARRYAMNSILQSPVGLKRFRCHFFHVPTY
jgi:hypothetical protein